MARPYLGGSSAGVESITAATTIGSSDHGKVFMVSYAATGSSIGSYQITIPTPANAGEGFSCKFIVSSATISDEAGEDVVINDGTNDTMVVNYVDAADSGAVSVVHDAAADTVGFDHTAKKGDWIEIFTDGTTWYCNGQSGADGGILVAT
tara:strand:+ start:1923 stop:2372 length:450 start_codon:yes stop_codon:yes gene_type:complete